MTDLKLLEAMKQNRIKAYEILMNQYMGYVVAVIRRVGKEQLTTEDIEEIASDVFAKLWEKRHGLNIGEGKLKAYIGVMARHLTINHLEKYYKWECITLEEDCIVGIRDKKDMNKVEQEIINNELQSALVQGIKELGEPDQEIFLRRYFYFEKVTEIAKQLKMNQQTVATKLYRGKEKLKKILLERGIKHD